MANAAPAGKAGGPYEAIMLKEYSHYGRFLKIQQDGLPPVYAGIENPTHPTNKKLQGKFMSMMTNLNALWMGGVGVISQETLWQNTLTAMRESAQAAQECWKAGIIPNWLYLDI